MTMLAGCPFCGNALTVRAGVNPMAKCDTPKCYFAERRIGISLDDPRQVDGWNQRAIPVTDAMAEAAARAAYGDQHFARYQGMMKKAIAAALDARK